MKGKSLSDFDNDLKSLLFKSKILEFDANTIEENEKIGSGGFGKVFKGKYLSLNLAIKKLKEYNPKHILREMKILRLYNYPFIPLFYGIVKHPEYFDKLINSNNNLLNIKDQAYKVDQTNPLHELNESYNNLKSPNHLDKQPSKFNKTFAPDFDIIFELVDGSSLESILKKEILTDLTKIVILLNLATAIEYIHNCNIIHRDLKPSNIMIDKKFEFKLVDFGISKISSSDEQTMTVSLGTVMYMAPENFFLKTISDNNYQPLINKQNSAGNSSGFIRSESNISVKVDVWAFGCIIHEMFTGFKPWTNRVDSDSKIMALLYHKKPFKIEKKLLKNEKLVRIIDMCTQVDPEKRITIKQAKNYLLEILYDMIFEDFEKFCLNMNDENNLKKGPINFYNSLKELNVNEKFHLLQKVECYLFQFLKLKHNENLKFKQESNLSYNKTESSLLKLYLEENKRSKFNGKMGKIMNDYIKGNNLSIQTQSKESLFFHKALVIKDDLDQKDESKILFYVHNQEEQVNTVRLFDKKDRENPDNDLNNIIDNFNDVLDKNNLTKFTFKSNNEDQKLTPQIKENLIQKNKGLFILSGVEVNSKKNKKINREISFTLSKNVLKFKGRDTVIKFNHTFSFIMQRNKAIINEISFFIDRYIFNKNSIVTSNNINFTIIASKANDSSNEHNMTESDIGNSNRAEVSEQRKRSKKLSKLSIPLVSGKNSSKNSEADNDRKKEYRDRKNNSVQVQNSDNLTGDLKLPIISSQYKINTFKEISLIFPNEISQIVKKEEIINQKNEFINFYNSLIHERKYAYPNSNYLNNLKSSIPNLKRQHVSNSLSMHNIVSEYSQFNREFVNRIMSPKYQNRVVEPIIYDYKKIERNPTQKSYSPG